jgi:hypothetical protein
VQSAVAGEPIHAFDAVLGLRRARQRAAELSHSHALHAQGRDHARQQRLQAPQVHLRTRVTKTLL